MRPCITQPLVIRDTPFGGPRPLFCIPLVAKDLEQLLAQARAAHDLHADVVEWRADSYGELSVTGLVEAACALRSALRREPILFTLRIGSEGGVQEMRQDLRLACIDEILRSDFVDLIDIELCNGPEVLQSIINTAHERAKRVIASFHDFQGTPSNETLLEKISTMVSHGTDIAKIACMPRESGDVLRLLQVTLTARQSFPAVPLCTISMGGLGFLSRVAGFLYGSDMTFALGTTSSAPGQIAIGEARAIAESLMRNQPRRTQSDFRDFLAHSGLWSCCGYDGLSIVFDVPLEAVQSLSEGQKRDMMRLLHRLAEGMDEKLKNQIAELEQVAAEDRLAGLVSLSAGFPA
jgi:3-dehydroquinate dehydratase-1